MAEFLSKEIGRFYGRIFERLLMNPICDFTTSLILFVCNSWLDREHFLFYSTSDTLPPNIFPHFGFRSGKIRTVRTFAQNFFEIFNVQTGKKYGRKTCRLKFFAILKFHAKNFPAK